MVVRKFIASVDSIIESLSRHCDFEFLKKRGTIPEVSVNDLVVICIELCRNNNIDITNYPNIKLYIDYFKLYESNRKGD